MQEEGVICVISVYLFMTKLFCWQAPKDDNLVSGSEQSTLQIDQKNKYLQVEKKTLSWARKNLISERESSKYSNSKPTPLLCPE
jgi:hypothetical protein